MKILIKDGRVIDPSNDIDEVLDIEINDNVIGKLGKNIKCPDAVVINAKEKIVSPGLIDMHVHFREPGFEHKEDIHSGLRAAVRGGFTGVCPMPNTNPVIQTQAGIEFVLRKSQSFNLANYYPVAAATESQKGDALTEYGELKKGGVIALSDDGGSPTRNSEAMRRSLEYAKKFDLVILTHCEDPDLFGNGCVNEGFMATKLGLPGIPVECESSMVARNIQLADMTDSRLHFCHISSKKSLDLIRHAKRLGSRITAETCPHYFTLTEEAVRSYNTNAKMNPPLRTQADLNAVKQALKDGTIDAIASDHAPHTESEKDLEFDKASFGIIGLETSLALSLRLVSEKVISMKQLIEAMSCKPANVLKLNRGTLSLGASADITIFDPDLEWKFTKETIESKSCNSPFLNWDLKGQATDVIVGGQIVLQNGRIRN